MFYCFLHCFRPSNKKSRKSLKNGILQTPGKNYLKFTMMSLKTTIWSMTKKTWLSWWESKEPRWTTTIPTISTLKSIVGSKRKLEEKWNKWKRSESPRIWVLFRPERNVITRDWDNFSIRLVVSIWKKEDSCWTIRRRSLISKKDSSKIELSVFIRKRKKIETLSTATFHWLISKSKFMKKKTLRLQTRFNLPSLKRT